MKPIQLRPATTREMSSLLLSYAQKLYGETRLRDKIAATFLLSAIAEYHAVRIFSYIKADGNIDTTNSIFFERFKKNTNLGWTLTDIKKLNDFDSKQELITILSELKEDRDDYFHKIILASKSGLSRSQLEKRIKENTEKLLKWQLDNLSELFMSDYELKAI